MMSYGLSGKGVQRMIQLKKECRITSVGSNAAFAPRGYLLHHPEHSFLYWHHEHCIPGCGWKRSVVMPS